MRTVGDGSAKRMAVASNLGNGRFPIAFIIASEMCPSVD